MATQAFDALATRATACDDARPMQNFRANADILTSARMAAGMTSRARRPETRTFAG